MSKWKNHEINIVLGDFNARLMEQLPEETHVIGKHIYRHPTSTIEDLSEQQNRQLFWFLHDAANDPHEHLVWKT